MISVRYWNCSGSCNRPKMGVRERLLPATGHSGEQLWLPAGGRPLWRQCCV